MWDCPRCGCFRIAADLPNCPMCQEVRDMPKATTGGSSNAWEPSEPDAEPVAEVPADGEVPPADVPAEAVSEPQPEVQVTARRRAKGL